MTDIHTLNIVFEGTQNGARLVFKDGAKADFARGALASALKNGETDIMLNDEFGLIINIQLSKILFFTVTDFVGDLEANQALSLLQAKAQVKFQKACEQDGDLRAFQASQALRRQFMNGGQAQS